MNISDDNFKEIISKLYGYSITELEYYEIVNNLNSLITLVGSNH